MKYRDRGSAARGALQLRRGARTGGRSGWRKVEEVGVGEGIGKGGILRARGFARGYAGERRDWIQRLFLTSFEVFQVSAVELTQRIKSGRQGRCERSGSGDCGASRSAPLVDIGLEGRGSGPCREEDRGKRE